jgi:hypothetical protein
MFKHTHVHPEPTFSVGIEIKNPKAAHLDFYADDEAFRFPMKRSTLELIHRRIGEVLAKSPRPERRRSTVSSATSPNK